MREFSGTIRILRFNWPYYVMSGLVFIACISAVFFPISSIVKSFIIVAGLIGVYFTIASIFVSYWVYDRSDLYRLTWLERIGLSAQTEIANIHAGYDETSHLLRLHFKNVVSYDFYDPIENTERSIERARKFSTGTSDRKMKIGDKIGPCDAIFLVLSAHEIRREVSRVEFFRALRASMPASGHIVLIEHLRNLANFLAFGPGFLHFLSDRTWKAAIEKSGLASKMEFAITPFLRCYVIQ